MLGPPHAVLGIRGPPRGPLTLTLPGLSPPISPALDEGRRPWPCSPTRRGDEPDRALCLLWGPSLGCSFQGLRTRLCGWDGGAGHAGGSGFGARSGGRDPSRVCCPSVSEARGPGKADSDCPKLEASHSWTCLGGGGLTRAVCSHPDAAPEALARSHLLCAHST